MTIELLQSDLDAIEELEGELETLTPLQIGTLRDIMQSIIEQANPHDIRKQQFRR